MFLQESLLEYCTGCLFLLRNKSPSDLACHASIWIWKFHIWLVFLLLRLIHLLHSGLLTVQLDEEHSDLWSTLPSLGLRHCNEPLASQRKNGPQQLLYIFVVKWWFWISLGWWAFLNSDYVWYIWFFLLHRLSNKITGIYPGFPWWRIEPAENGGKFPTLMTLLICRYIDIKWPLFERSVMQLLLPRYWTLLLWFHTLNSMPFGRIWGNTCLFLPLIFQCCPRLSHTLIFYSWLLCNSCSSFADIYNVDHFIEVLKDDIEIVKDLPGEFSWSTREYYAAGIRETRVKSAPVHASANWYLDNVLPILQRSAIENF